jgi:hypothetical protein
MPDALALLLSLQLLQNAGSAGAGCVCTEQKWCSPVATPPPAKEIFAFALAGGGAEMPAETTTQQWPRFNWDLVTTVAWDIGANETVCFAHSKGVRVVIPASGPFALYGGANTKAFVNLMLNSTARKQWLAMQLASVAEYGADGMVFDIEGAEQVLNKTAAAMASLLHELKTEGKKTNPHFGISFTTPVYVGQAYISSTWHHNAGTGYDWASLKKVVDFFIPMACKTNTIVPMLSRSVRVTSMALS